MKEAFATYGAIHWYVLIPALLLGLISFWLTIPFIFLAVALVNNYVGGHWFAPNFDFVMDDYHFYLKLLLFCYLFWTLLLFLPSFLKF